VGHQYKALEAMQKLRDCTKSA